MVCDRCIAAVAHILDHQHISYTHIKLGEVQLNAKLSSQELDSLNEEFKKIGFQILQSETDILTNSIKQLIIEKISQQDIPEDFRISDLIASHFSKDYNTLSKIFSTTQNQTIEQFFILQKIEKVKELLSYSELSIKEISFKLGYKNTSHLSNQFKTLTQVSPSEYRKTPKSDRKSLDKI